MLLMERVYSRKRDILRKVDVHVCVRAYAGA